MYPCDEVCRPFSFPRVGCSCAVLTRSVLQDEKDRMDIFHKLFLVARRDELHTAPFTPNYDGPRILDLGCGTGIWSIDMAE